MLLLLQGALILSIFLVFPKIVGSVEVLVPEAAFESTDYHDFGKIPSLSRQRRNVARNKRKIFALGDFPENENSELLTEEERQRRGFISMMKSMNPFKKKDTNATTNAMTNATTNAMTHATTNAMTHATTNVTTDVNAVDPAANQTEGWGKIGFNVGVAALKGGLSNTMNYLSGGVIGTAPEGGMMQDIAADAITDSLMGEKGDKPKLVGSLGSGLGNTLDGLTNNMTAGLLGRTLNGVGMIADNTVGAVGKAVFGGVLRSTINGLVKGAMNAGMAL